MRIGDAQLYRIGRAMDVYVAAHGIAFAQPVEAHFATGQPQDTRQYPVPPGKLGAQFRCIDFPGRAAAYKHGIFGLPCASSWHE